MLRSLPKPKRVVDTDLIKSIYDRDGGCLYSIRRPNCWGGFSVHHIVKRSQGGGDVPENLIELCMGHHDDAEAHRITPEELREVMTEVHGFIYEEK